MFAGEVRGLLQHRQVEIHRKLGGGGRQHWATGDLFWVREPFASRRDGEMIRIRYSELGPKEARVIDFVRGLKQFANSTYRGWPGKYMPRPFSRLTVELVEVREEAGDGLVLGLKVATGDCEGRT